MISSHTEFTLEMINNEWFIAFIAAELYNKRILF